MADNWCQSWLDFPDRNPKCDDIIYADLMSPIYFTSSWELTNYKFSHKFTGLEGMNYISIESLTF